MRTMELKAQYEEYLENLEEGKAPMTLDEYAEDLACEADYIRMTREP